MNETKEIELKVVQQIGKWISRELAQANHMKQGAESKWPTSKKR